jgi:hypothetical protein
MRTCGWASVFGGLQAVAEACNLLLSASSSLSNAVMCSFGGAGNLLSVFAAWLLHTPAAPTALTECQAKYQDTSCRPREMPSGLSMTMPTSINKHNTKTLHHFTVLYSSIR